MELLKFIKINRYKLFKTLITYLTFIGHGGMYSLIGSSLLDLQIRLQTSFETTSRLVPARAIGYIIGASSCTLYEKRFDDYLVLAISTFFGSIFLNLVPQFKVFEYMFVSLMAAGFTQGIFNIYGISVILKIWGHKQLHWYQLLNMSFGIGALINPVYTRPFLLPLIPSQDNSTSEDASIIGNYSPDDVQVQYAFMINGAIFFFVSIIFFFIYLREKNSTTKVEKKDESKGDKTDISTAKKVGAVFLASLLSNLCFGVEVIVANLCTAFAVKADIAMDKKTAVLLASVFWSTFSFYRVIFMLLTLVIKEVRVFLFNIFILLVGVAVLVPQAAYQTTFTWVAFILLGIGYSPVFSVSFGSLGNYFQLTNAMTSFIYINGVLGETFHTSILSTFMDQSPVIFVYYLGGMSVVYVIVSLSLPIYCKKVIGTPKETKKEEIEIPEIAQC